jgi:type II secretory pathway pseudopilin PulG
VTSILKRFSGDSGFSIVELIIALGLFLLLMMALFRSLDSGTRAESVSSSRADALTDVRAAMTRITRDVRQTSSVDVASTGSVLKIQSLIDGAPHHIDYTVVSGATSATLQRRVDDGTPMTLVDRIPLSAASSTFCYDPPTCSGSGPPANPTSIRISITLTPVSLGTGQVTLATDIQLRNVAQY